MKFTRLRAVGIVAGVAALAFITTPASAGSVIAADADGVDSDAGCVIGDPQNATAPPAAPNNIPSTNPAGASGGGLQGGTGCDGISTYDGGTETVDFNDVTLSTSGTKVTATFNVDGPIPAAGAGAASGADLPDATFVGFGYKAMFQNTTRQTNTPYVAATRLTGTPIFGLNEHWQDGFHFYIGFSANFTGTGWTHSADYGIYDPGPDGAFFFTELGTNNGSGWGTGADPCMPRGSHWDVTTSATSVSVTMEGVARFSNIQAQGGCINDERVKPGDDIVNVKGFATADSTVVLPVTIPLSLIPGESDITSVGGFLYTVDFTPGNSRNVGTVGTALQPNRVGLPNSGGFLGLVDTLGDGPRCWTSTFGGLAPSNPLWVANQPCYIDDDVVPGPSGNIDPGLGRGSILEEWWDTAYGFTA